MKTNFKVGDRVYHILYGWGKVTSIDDADASVAFVNTSAWFLTETNLLSFTEYTLQGFSQERPLEFPEVGEEVMVSDDSINWKLAKFIKFRTYDNDYLVQIGRIQESFGFIKRLRQ